MFTINRITKRAFTALALILIFQSAAHSQAAAKRVKNVVLVHGAFADGSSWAKVTAILQNKGLNVVAVQNPLTSLEDDVAATRRAIASLEGPVFLVGHSWGGMVITEAGNDPKVAGLMYVSALIPDDGQSVEDVVKAFPPAPGNAEFRQSPSGFLFLSFKGMNEFFAPDLRASDRNVMYATQVQWAASSTVQKIKAAAWKTKPSWCVIATRDQIINPALERAEAKMIKATTIEVNASHVPMISQPEKVSDFILSAIASFI